MLSDGGCEEGDSPSAVSQALPRPNPGFRLTPCEVVFLCLCDGGCHPRTSLRSAQAPAGIQGARLVSRVGTGAASQTL